MKNVLIWGVALIGGYYLLTRARALSTLNFVMRGIGFGGGGVQVNVGVQNPTSTPLTLSSIYGNIIAPDGTSIGNFSSFYQQQIAPNAETPVLLTITGNVVGILAEAVNALTGGSNISGHYKVEGFANVNGSAFPVNFPVA